MMTSANSHQEFAVSPTAYYISKGLLYHQGLTVSRHLFKHVDILTYVVLLVILELNTVIILVLKVRRLEHREMR